MFSVIKSVISVILSVIMLLPSIFTQSAEQAEADRKEQIMRVDFLEHAYNYGSMPKVNEADIVEGDYAAALADGIKFNELSFVATHNSYQTKAVPALRELEKRLSEITKGAVSDKTGLFNSETLTGQLYSGIRSLELDIETVEKDGKVSFDCMHSPCIDMATNSYDLSLALKEIRMWSDYNPGHIPITIIIEPKKFFLPMKGMKFLDIDYTLKLEKVLREGLGDKLFTPADMLRSYESFAEMRFADDWCKVEDMLGKVLVLLHDTNVTEEYIALDESVKTQAMFPMLRYKHKDLPYAGFLLINKPQEALEYSEEITGRYKFIVRTQVDTYTSVSPIKRRDAMNSRAQILSTDYPVRSDLRRGEYYVSFENNKTVKIMK